MGDLKVSMYYHGASSFPCLRSRAAETKHLAQPMLYAFEKLMAPGNEQHKLVLLLLKLTVKLETLMEDNKDEYVLSPAVAED